MKMQVLGALLIASIALNLWLLVGKGRVEQGDSPSATHATKADRDAEKIVEQGASSKRTAGTAPGLVEESHAAAEISDLRARLRVLEAEHRAHLPSSKRFEEGAPDPESQQRVQAKLQSLMPSDGGANPWTVECRDQVCKVDVFVENAAQWHEQMQLLQTSPRLTPMIASYSFMGGTPTQDVVSGKQGIEYANYLDIRSEQDTEAGNALAAVVAQFRGSDALKDCTGGYSQKGLVQLELTLEPGGAFHAETVGAGLGATSVGTCLRERALAIANAASLPSPETKLAFGVYLQSPPPAP
jgi:hypothetical protein